MILDTDSDSDVTTAITLTTESVITLYVLPGTGTHKKHRVALQVSPDGTKWRRFGQPVRGVDVETYVVAAAKARAKVIRPEGSTSTSDVFLIAK